MTSYVSPMYGSFPRNALESQELDDDKENDEIGVDVFNVGIGKSSSPTIVKGSRALLLSIVISLGVVCCFLGLVNTNGVASYTELADSTNMYAHHEEGSSHQSGHHDHHHHEHQHNDKVESQQHYKDQKAEKMSTKQSAAHSNTDGSSPPNAGSDKTQYVPDQYKQYMNKYAQNANGAPSNVAGSNGMNAMVAYQEHTKEKHMPVQACLEINCFTEVGECGKTGGACKDCLTCLFDNFSPSVDIKIQLAQREECFEKVKEHNPAHVDVNVQAAMNGLYHCAISAQCIQPNEKVQEHSHEGKVSQKHK